MNHKLRFRVEPSWALNLFLFVVLVTVGCGRRESLNASKETNALDSLLAKLIAPSPAKVALLAAKHEIAEDALSLSIRDYLHLHDATYQILEKVADGKKIDPVSLDIIGNTNLSVSSTLSNLATKYHIPREKLASAFVDYLMWKEIENAIDSSQRSPE